MTQNESVGVVRVRGGWCAKILLFHKTFLMLSFHLNISTSNFTF
jgi:hypothetical protein